MNTPDYKYDFDFKYKKPHKYPVRLSFEDDKLVIYVFAKFSKALLKPYKPLNPDVSDSALRCKNSNFTYVDAICEGIIRNWNGLYQLPNGDNIRLDVKIIRYNKAKTKQRYLHFYHELSNNFSFVRSPIHRCLWGIFKGRGHFESLGLNWSPSNPGSVFLRRCLYLRTYEQTAAHEFGHVLGIGDAYGAFYRFFYEAPGTERYMMNHNTKVQPEEVMMMLKAQKTGRMQYFPLKFAVKNFKNEFKTRKAIYRSKRMAKKNKKQNLK